VHWQESKKPVFICMPKCLGALVERLAALQHLASMLQKPVMTQDNTGAVLGNMVSDQKHTSFVSAPASMSMY
jgi:hypothetical protein